MPESEEQEFVRGSKVYVDLTDRGHGTRAAVVRSALGSNDRHDYRVAFPVFNEDGELEKIRRVDVQADRVRERNE